jgi:hypothetical protein
MIKNQQKKKNLIKTKKIKQINKNQIIVLKSNMKRQIN